MKVGIFTEVFYPEISGVATACLELKEGLEEAGHEVFVFTVTNHEADAEWDLQNHVYRVLSIPFVLFDERRIGLPLLSSIMQTIEDLNLDIIHTQSEFSLGALGRRAAKKFNIPMLHTYHTLYEEYLHYLKLQKNELTINLVGKFVENFTKHSYAIICPSQKTKDALLSYGIKNKIYIIPTGIDLKKFKNFDSVKVETIKKKYHIKDQSVILISVSRLSDEKRLNVLLDYFYEYLQNNPDKDISLIIAGDGPDKEKLKQQSENLKIADKVIFTGYIEWQNVQNYYQASDIFVSASKSETQGLTYLEALAANIPILAQKDPCLNHLLIDGKNGKAFDNRETFAAGLDYLINQVKFNAEFKPSDNLYTRNDFIEQILDVYEQAIENNI